MRFLFSFLLTISYLFANIGTVVDVVGNSTLTRGTKKIKVIPKLELKKHDFIKTGKNAKVKIFFKDNTAVSLGRNTYFEIDSYFFNNTKKSNIKFKVAKGFFKTVTGKIGKVAPNRFKLKTKTATIGIRGTVFAAEVTNRADVVMCTDGAIVLFTPSGDIELPAGNISRVKKGVRPKTKRYSQAQKEALIKNAGWHGTMSLKELIAYIKKNFKEPLRSQLLATLQNILDKDSDERKRYMPKPKVENADDVGFVDEITINGREFDSLDQREIEFYLEDLVDGKVVVKGILESEDESISPKDLYVEITVDGGNRWSRAKGHEEWEWSFRPKLENNYEFSLRIVRQNIPKKFKLEQIVPDKETFTTKRFIPKTDYKKVEEFNPKTVTTKPIVIKFRNSTETISESEPFTPKVITTEAIVIKFRNSTETILESEPFTPKVITTEAIVIKFRNSTPDASEFVHFTPKVITTEPIILKFKSF